jgi:uncharacterized membrane protein
VPSPEGNIDGRLARAKPAARSKSWKTIPQVRDGLTSAAPLCLSGRGGVECAVMILFALPVLLLLGLALLLVVFVLMVELRILRYAYRKIGVPPRYMFAVLVVSLVGSHVNIPLYAVGRTVVAINVGGALVPILLSVYLFFRTRLYGRMVAGTVIVALIVHALARVVPGAGIAVPMLIPPLVAAAVGLVLSFRRAPPVAYVAGSMGTLVGADLLNLHRVADIGARVVSIGGAGTFDGVFLTGIIAGLLS